MRSARRPVDRALGVVRVPAADVDGDRLDADLGLDHRGGGLEGEARGPLAGIRAPPAGM